MGKGMCKVLDGEFLPLWSTELIMTESRMERVYSQSSEWQGRREASRWIPGKPWSGSEGSNSLCLRLVSVSCGAGCTKQHCRTRQWRHSPWRANCHCDYCRFRITVEKDVAYKWSGFLFQLKPNQKHFINFFSLFFTPAVWSNTAVWMLKAWLKNQLDTLMEQKYIMSCH